MKNSRFLAAAAAVLALATGGIAIAQTTPAPSVTAPPAPGPVAPGSPENPRGASPGGATYPTSNTAPSPMPSASATP